MIINIIIKKYIFLVLSFHLIFIFYFNLIVITEIEQ